MCWNLKIPIGIHTQELGGCLWVVVHQGLLHVIGHQVGEEGDHGGVDLFDECWTVCMIQYWLQPRVIWVSYALLFHRKGEGGWGGRRGDHWRGQWRLPVKRRIVKRTRSPPHLNFSKSAQSFSICDKRLAIVSPQAGWMREGPNWGHSGQGKESLTLAWCWACWDLTCTSMLFW